MEKAGRAWQRQIDQASDPSALAHELLIARDAGYLTFEDSFYGGSHRVDPRVDAHYWLQQIGNIQLTLAGRDRAFRRGSC